MEAPLSVIVEACVESIEAAMAAEELGADRVELCMGLAEGGTTPSLGMIELARAQLRIPLHVIIRPRGGDFCYSDLELESMRRDIQAARQAGAEGIVTGVLREDGAVDAQKMQGLLEAAGPMNVTFHRAFDMARDPHEALESLMELGVTRILTSGQQPSVMEGLDLIREMIVRAEGRLVVMPGGGIRETNVREIVSRTGATEIHIRAAGVRESPMRFRNTRLALSGGPRPGEFELPAIHSPRLEACLRVLRGT
jgi:copper homeostasis protein